MNLLKGAYSGFPFSANTFAGYIYAQCDVDKHSALFIPVIN